MTPQNEQTTSSEVEKILQAQDKAQGHSGGPSLEEKIDFLYRHLKWQQRFFMLKRAWKIFLFLVGVYFFFFYLPSLPDRIVEHIKASTKEDVSSGIERVSDRIKNFFPSKTDQ